MSENTVETVESVPVLGSLDKADVIARAGVMMANLLADKYNVIANNNSGSNKSVEEIRESLRLTSTNAEVVKLRAAIDEATAKADALLHEEAKAIKASVGTPDVEGEKAALAAHKAALRALAAAPDGDKVSHFLTALVSSKTALRNVTGVSTGPKRDLTAVRTWAKNNGFEIGERGAIKPEILTAYADATGASV